MKRLSIIIAALLFSTILLSAQNMEQTIAVRVEELTHALTNPTKAKLDQLVSEKLSYGHSSGLVENKTAFVAALLDGTTDFVSIKLSDQTIELVENIAIVRHRLFAETNNKGAGAVTANISVLLIWQNVNGKWLLLARQATKIPPAVK